MKLEIDFSETDSEGLVMNMCLVQYRRIIQADKDSKFRYHDIVHNLIPNANKQDRKLLQEECDQIEADWKRMGVEF